jgi:hypothetical protein
MCARARINVIDPTSHERPSRAVWIGLAIAFLLGLGVRQWAYTHSASIRYELNQQNAFYWGDRVVHGDNRRPGAASLGEFWRSYVALYEINELAPGPRANTLDYVPLRLLMAGAWVNYLNTAYGPVSEWRPEFARSFSAFSMVMELAGAIAMFALVARWLRQTESNRSPAPRMHTWGRWEYATAAAALVWLNPASIVDSHVWPHGQTWILPFYLAAVVAMIERRHLLAGAIFGIGMMFKGQMLLIAPMLILWPIFDRRFAAASRVVIGMLAGVGTIVSPWLIRGSFAWARAGFAANGMYSDVLRKGTALNLPAVLEKLGMTLHEHLIDTSILGVHVKLELKALLIVTYILLLVACSIGIARQARSGDRRFLVSLAAPWALMFFVLGQMDERYLVWCACFSAGAIAVNRKTLAAHMMLSIAGAATMIEFLLITNDNAAPRVMRVLTAINPAIWLITAAAVCVLFFTAVRSSRASQSRATDSDLPAAQLLPGMRLLQPSR